MYPQMEKKIEEATVKRLAKCDKLLSSVKSILSGKPNTQMEITEKDVHFLVTLSVLL